MSGQIEKIAMRTLMHHRSSVLETLPTVRRLLEELHGSLNRADDIPDEKLERIAERVATLGLDISEYRISAERHRVLAAPPSEASHE